MPRLFSTGSMENNSNKMDRLDRISIWAIAILVIGSSALISHHMGEAVSDKNNRQKILSSAVTIFNPELENKVKAARGLMEGANLAKAEILVRELLNQYPYEGEPRMLMGDLYMRKQDPVKAMFEYKEAIDLNPDYLDRKTPLFQGKKLKIAAREALEEIEKKIKAGPEDENKKKDRKVIYYLQRRIAGSCG